MGASRTRIVRQLLTESALIAVAAHTTPVYVVAGAQELFIKDIKQAEADIAAGVEHLHSLGASRIVLLGQSMGTNRVLYYQAASGDSSIAATVLVSGPGSSWLAKLKVFSSDSPSMPDDFNASFAASNAMSEVTVPFST